MKKFAKILLCLLLTCTFALTGCSLVQKNTARYLNKTVATVENACTLKNSTFWGAYSYAVGTNQTYISPDNPDVVYFSSYDYLDYGGKYYTDSPQIQVERSYLEYVNTLSFDSVPGVKMDSVYIRSLDAYCTIDQYNNYLENGIIVQNEDGTIELGDVHE